MTPLPPPAGSPFSVKVTGEGRVKESITRRRRAPPEASVGTACDLSLKMPGERPWGVPECPWGGLGKPRGTSERPWGGPQGSREAAGAVLGEMGHDPKYLRGDPRDRGSPKDPWGQSGDSQRNPRTSPGTGGSLGWWWVPGGAP